MTIDTCKMDVPKKQNKQTKNRDKIPIQCKQACK